MSGESYTDEVFISYLDDDDVVINGYFKLVEDNLTFIKIKTNENVITIPWHRILKIKERVKNG